MLRLNQQIAFAFEISLAAGQLQSLICIRRLWATFLVNSWACHGTCHELRRLLSISHFRPVHILNVSRSSSLCTGRE